MALASEQLRAKVQLVADLPGHDDRAWHIAWNPSKPLLASCSSDKTVRLYNYRLNPSSSSHTSTNGTFEPITFSHNATIPTGHTKTVRAVTWSPSGQTLATASFDSNIGIWAQDEGEDGEWECMSLLEGHETECKSVAYSASGTLLASCSRDKTVWIWEVQPDSDFECMGVLMEHTQDVKCVAWHPKEEILASASYDDTIKLYLDDPSDDWFCATTLSGHDSTVWTLAWEPINGKYLASGSDDHTIRIWRITGGQMSEMKGELVDLLEGHGNAPVYSLSWSQGKSFDGPAKQDGSLGWLISAGGDGGIVVWELFETPGSTASATKIKHKIIARLDSAHDVFDVNSVVWCSRAGLEDVFATAGDDGHVKIWKVDGSTPTADS